MEYSKEHLYPIILAGGVGTRLWPLSRTRAPKQLHSFFGPSTLLEQAYKNLRRGFPRRAVHVSTNATSAAAVRALLPQLPAQNLIIEPVRRNTAVPLSGPSGSASPGLSCRCGLILTPAFIAPLLTLC